MGEARSVRAALHCALTAREGHGREYVSRAVVMDYLRGRYGCGQLDDQAEARAELQGLVYGATEIPSEGHLPLYQRPIFWAVIVARRLHDFEHHFLVGSAMTEDKGLISIWFFIGVLLLAYGVLILGAGYLRHQSRRPNIRSCWPNLHAAVWWGASAPGFRRDSTRIKFFPHKRK